MFAPKSFAMIEIRNFKKVDTDRILAIADSLLGEKYITETDLSFSKVFIAECNDTKEVVGFCIAYIDSTEGKSYVRTVAVDSAFSGQGIGTALVAKSVEYLKSVGAKKIMSPLWKHDGVVNSDVVFRRNGFCPVLEIPDYWYADSIAKGYFCPVCGKGCRCKCVMYELNG